MSITYCACVRACVCVALVIQHAMRMLYIVVCGLPVSKIYLFPTLCDKRYDFQKKEVTEHKMCIFIYSAPLV
jgi:hypothetical protein